SESFVALGSRPAPTTRSARSRSVTMPTTRPLSCTTTVPMRLLSMARAASIAVVVGPRTTMRGWVKALRLIAHSFHPLQDVQPETCFIRHTRREANVRRLRGSNPNRQRKGQGATVMKAAVFVEPGRIVLDDKPIPDVGPLDAL